MIAALASRPSDDGPSFIFKRPLWDVDSPSMSISGGSWIRNGSMLSSTISFASIFGLPPKIISVPLPAILVEIVIACFLPACAIISASLAAYFGLALRTL
uniref:Uncharacterized protein n=1 Tax=Arundo donax TaxID=35708 RepID=A0A0A9GDB5_ARUDO